MGVAVGGEAVAGVHEEGSGRRHSAHMIETAATTTTGLADIPPPPAICGGCICGREEMIKNVREGDAY